MERNGLSNFGKGSLKDPSCKIISKSVCPFCRRSRLKQNVDNARTTDKDWSQKLTMSTSCSGELKMYRIFAVLRLIGAVFGTASVVKTVNKYSLYGHLLHIQEKHLTESFASDWAIITKASCLTSSEWAHFRPHGNLWMNYSISIVTTEATMAVAPSWSPPV